MMKFKSPKITYSLKLALNGLFKNRVMTLSSIFVLLSCLAIMGTFVVVIKNINHNISKIDGFNKIVLFVDREADEYEVEQMGKELLEIPHVESVEFKHKDEALREEVQRYKEAEFLFEMYKNDNPLKDSYIITYDPDANVESVKLYIESRIDHISKLNVNMEVVNQIQNLKNVIAIIFSWLLILLLFVSLFVIINTVKLSVYARRDEISLMRYIGATNSFISRPFLIEGLIIGVLSAVFAFGLEFLIYKYLMLELANQYEIISILPFSDVSGLLVYSFAIIGIIMGFVGSLISLKKYNKENV